MGKLTPEQEALRFDVAEAVINVAARPPGLRGPWIFDEAKLQAQAVKA